jgi:hypothetical protein
VDGHIGPSKFKPPTDEENAFASVLLWLQRERNYTIEKFGVESDLQHVEDFNLHSPDNATHFDIQLETYLHRAGILGIHNPNGLQALAKFVSTAVGMLAAATQAYGPLPRPGVSSGEIQEWELG